MSEHITGDELEESLDYFAEVFAYASETIDDEKPGLEAQAGKLAGRYRRYGSEKIEQDIRRMKKTIEEGRFPDDYPDDLVWKSAAQWAQHSEQYVNRQRLNFTVEQILDNNLEGLLEE